MKRLFALALVGLIVAACGSETSAVESVPDTQATTSSIKATSTTLATTTTTTSTTTTTTTTVPPTTTIPPVGEAGLAGTWDATVTYPEDANVEEFGGAVRERVWVFEEDCLGDECTTTAIIATALGEFTVEVERQGNAGREWTVTHSLEPALEGGQTVCEWEEILTYLITVDAAEMIDGRWTATSASGTLDQAITVAYEAPEVQCDPGEPIAAEVEMTRRP
jgi:hypothetical protein